MEAPPLTLLQFRFVKSDPGASGVHSDGVMGAVKPFAKPKCGRCSRNHVKGVPCFGFVKVAGEWDESKHPRGEPENKGEFGPGGGSTFTPLPRSSMPQLGGKPTPNTPSATLPVNVRGNVDLSDPFLAELKSRGVTVTDKSVDPRSLKPSQSEINPTTVDTLANAKLPPGEKIKPLWVSNDGHVIDGHHRWAADVQKGEKSIDVREIDLPIQQALDEARAFGSKWGVKQETVGESSTANANATPAPTKSLPDVALQQAETKGGFSLHPKTGGAPAGGFMVALPGHSQIVEEITDLKDPAQRVKVHAAIKRYIQAQAATWKSNDKLYVGGWFDREHHEFTLDPSENVLDEGATVTLGGQRNQQSIFDVIGRKEIDTHGTGDRPGTTGTGVLKATGGWLRGRTRRVDRGVHRSGGRSLSANPLNPHDWVDSAAWFERAVGGGQGAIDQRATPQFEFVKTFDPDEPRDSHGEWSSDGDGGAGDGGGSAGVGKPAGVSQAKWDRGLRLARQHQADAASLYPDAASKKDSKPTRAMKGLVKRDGVKTYGNLQPGDVLLQTRIGGQKAYQTIEHVQLGHMGPHAYGVEPNARGADTSVSYIARRPSGRMVMGSAGATTELGDTLYVGSEPSKPTTRDGVEFSPGLLNGSPRLQHAAREVRQAVDIVESRAVSGSLKGLVVRSGDHVNPNAYAEYRRDTGSPDRWAVDSPELVINNKWLGEGSMSLAGTPLRAPEADAALSLGRSYGQTVTSKFHPNRNGYSSLTAITVHELGHHLHMSPIKTRLGPNVNRLLSNLDEGFSYFENGAVGEGSTVNVAFNKTVAKTVSSYATENIREFVAEAYSEGMLADRPRPIAKLVAKTLNHEEVTDGDLDAANKQWQLAKGAVERDMEKHPLAVQFKMVPSPKAAAASHD